jgi:putative phosphoribosyl transferase
MPRHYAMMTGHNQVEIAVGDVRLEGDLYVPEEAKGVVLFAHGSGSGRHSPRNQFVAGELNAGGLATFLMDLLTRYEEEQDRYTGHLRFDIGLLADRLVGATEWLIHQKHLRDMKVGYFGASTGGGAALVAAAKCRRRVSAVVSRGGRPDLAGEALPQVVAPTLLIVGGNDKPVIEMNRQAMRQMQCEHKLEIVPGATHLFEEPGTLQQVAALAREWFQKHLPG